VCSLSDRGKRSFPHRPDGLSCTQPPIQWHRLLLIPGVNRPWHKADDTFSWRGQGWVRITWPVLHMSLCRASGYTYFLISFIFRYLSVGCGNFSSFSLFRISNVLETKLEWPSLAMKLPAEKCGCHQKSKGYFVISTGRPRTGDVALCFALGLL
jgi:hypothetical protein